jgi:hypothetical protein
MKLILFEDLQARDFYPLGETRPVWELRTGLGTLRQRIEWRLDLDAEGGLCRGELQGVAARLGLPVPELESDEDVLLVNARLLEFDPEEILALDQGQGILDGDVLIAARLVASGLDDMEEGGPELDVIEAACDPILGSGPSPEGRCRVGLPASGSSSPARKHDGSPGVGGSQRPHSGC